MWTRKKPFKISARCNGQIPASKGRLDASSIPLNLSVNGHKDTGEMNSGSTKASTETTEPRPWHTMDETEVCHALGLNDAGGLTAADAFRRLEHDGPNELTSSEHVTAWRILLEQFQNVLIIVLLVATFLSFYLGHDVESIAIGVIVLFSVILGFVQEYRAEKAIESLRRLAAPSATVVRDGKEQDVRARDLVRGDLILLATGDKVPADARLIDAANLRIDEALLTGESNPVDKITDPLDDPGAGVADRTNLVYSGTSVAYGRGRALVVATGDHTEMGRLAESLRTVESAETPLQKNLDKVGRILALIGFAIVAVIVGIGIIRDYPLVNMFIFGVALAIAVVPEALPAVVTVSLAIGVQRMIKRNVLIRRLPAVETLGTTSVICSDKTGTLTKDEMTVRRIVVADAEWEITGTGFAPDGVLEPVSPRQRLETAEELLMAACLASDARLVENEGRWEIHGDPTEGALVVAARKAGMDADRIRHEHKRMDEIPFSSDTKRMTVLCQLDDGIHAFAKGAPEIILSSCTTIRTAHGHEPLDSNRRSAMQQAATQMAGEAMRVIAVAGKSSDDKASAEEEMTLLGLIGMIDPPRPEAIDAIKHCRQAGIRVVMITGDHPDTAGAVARELGLLHRGRVVSGTEIESFGDAQLARDVLETDVYARVSPRHKLRIVEAFQSHGAIVAVTGDGANDAPALKRANIGIAMGINGTDVAKEAADMMLTDDNFASIAAAVEEGRAIFDNIKKYLMYLLSSNIGEIGLISTTSALGYPLPLSAVQLLYVNLATDGLPALALAVDPIDEQVMHRPPRDAHKGIFNVPVVSLMLVGGIWSTLANLGVFIWAQRQSLPTNEAMTMTFTSLVLIQFFKAYCFRSDRNSSFHRPLANRWLNAAIAWELLLLAVVIYLPILHKPMGTFSLSIGDWLVVGSAALSVIPIMELAKWTIRRLYPLPEVSTIDSMPDR